MKKKTDAELVKSLSRGSSKTFTEIFNRYYIQLFYFTKSRTNDAEYSKDSVEEIFNELWSNRKNLTIDKLDVYLYSAARSRILDYFKKNNASQEYIDAMQHGLDTNYYDKNHQTDLKSMIEREMGESNINEFG